MVDKWEVGKYYVQSNAADVVHSFTFEVTAVDPYGNAIIRFKSGGFTIRTANWRPDYVEFVEVE